jgi:hypothetical protein
MAEKFIRVPFYVEPDGSKTFFLPNLKRPKGFQIGPKGSEEYFDDYWQALSKLMAMKTPKFRRKNNNNIPGIVSCKPGDVEEVKLGFIEEQLSKGL